jgi:poly [ADP-ribose] polymerase
MEAFEKKFKDKTTLKWENRGAAPKPGKYVFLEKSYEPDSSENEEGEEDDAQPGPTDKKADRSRSASPVKCSLAAPVKSLMELIFNQEHMDSVMAVSSFVGDGTSQGLTLHRT